MISDRRALEAALIAAALSLLWVSVARAQNSYRELLDLGGTAYNAGDAKLARSYFEQAHDLNPGARTLRMLGYCDVNLHHYARALSHLEQALGESREPLNDHQRLEVSRVIDGVHGEMGRLRIETLPQDAQLELDGVAQTARELWLEPGPHRLRLTANQHQPNMRVVLVTRRGEEQIRVELEALEVTARVEVEPAAAPPPKSAAAPDTGKQSSLPARLDEPSNDAAGGRVRAAVAFGVGAVAVVIGGLAGSISLMDTQAERSRCVDGHCAKDRADELHRANTLANVANVGLLIGALSLGYGLFEVLTLPSPASSSKATSGLRVELNGVGATLRGNL